MAAHIQRSCVQALLQQCSAAAGAAPLLCSTPSSWSSVGGSLARCLCTSSGGAMEAMPSQQGAPVLALQQRHSTLPRPSHLLLPQAAAAAATSSTASAARHMSGCAVPAAAARPAATPAPKQPLHDAAEPAAPSLSALRSRLAQGPNFTDFVTGSELKEGPYSVQAHAWKERKRKPDWMKRNVLPGGEKYTEIKSKLRELKLHTVCEEAKCPNIGECWGGGDGHTATATIMLMGDTCTRGCRFCAVKTSRAPPPLDPMEPSNVSKAIAAWGLDYVVLTSVDRDDLADGGAAHIAETVQRLKQETQGKLLVEALVPDFQGNHACVQQIVESGLDVFAHNIETVQRLQKVVRDRRAGWEQSLGVLAAAKRMGARVTKSSIMLGCGEAQHEVVDTLRALRDHGVDVVTLGQYMQPTKKHMGVSEYVTPDAFAAYQRLAEEMGFLYVASGPMVRSSYRAGEFYLTNVLRGQRGGAAAAAGGDGAEAPGGPGGSGQQQQQEPLVAAVGGNA